MKDLRIVFFGTPEYVIPILRTLNENFKIVGVITTSDQPVGRKKIMTQTPVADEANTFGLPVLKPEKLNSELADQLTSLEPDLFVVASYGKIIPKSVLEIPKLGAINVHPSELPKYRGASPIQSQILDGVKESAVSFIKMDEEMDHGPLIYTSQFMLSEQDTFNTLSKKMFLRSAEILPKIIEDFVNGKITPTSQPHSKATFCNHITKEDGYFDLNNPPTPEKLDRMIRAYSHWPNVWTKWSPSAKATGDKNGKIVKFLPDELIQMEGKTPVKLKDFLNGYPTFPLKSLQNDD